VESSYDPYGNPTGTAAPPPGTRYALNRVPSGHRRQLEDQMAGGSPRRGGGASELRQYASDVFEALDNDRSGALEIGEFRQAMRTMGFEGDESDITAVFYAVSDGIGRVPKKEFINHWVANHSH